MKKNCVKKTFAAILALSIFVSSTVSVSATTLNIPRIEQAKSNWCWAAAATMVGKYVKSSSTRTQANAVSKIKGAELNVGGTLWDVEAAIEYVSYDAVNAYAAAGNRLTAAQVDVDLIAGRPLVFRIYWGSLGAAHMITCSGRSGNELRLVDPAVGCGTYWRDRDDLVNGTSLQSGTGSYEDTIYLI